MTAPIAPEELSTRERSLMEHATAWKHRNRLYRNHFTTGPDTDDWATVVALCDRGLMRVRVPPSDFAGGMTTFAVTENGLVALERRTR